MAMSDIPENGPVVYKVFIWCAGGCLCFVEYVVLTRGNGCYACCCLVGLLVLHL